MSVLVGFHDLFSFIKIWKGPGDFINEVKAHRRHEGHEAEVDDRVWAELTIRNSFCPGRKDAFRSLDICRSEPFLRLIPLNLSDHQKGIYALRCLVFLVYLIAATSQWSSLLWWIAITNLLLYPISLNDSQVALCFLISNPLTARQTSHH